MISVIYPIRGRFELLRNTIESIEAYAKGIKDKFEIIIVDSLGEEQLIRYCERKKKEWDLTYVHYQYPNTKGRHSPAYAFNLGVRLSKYNSVVLTSPEIMHETEVIEQLLDYVGSNVICKVRDVKQNGKFGIALVSSTFRADNPGMYFIGMYNKEDYETIGGIDEQFMEGESFEDTDFGVRFKAAGFDHIVCDQIVGHHQFHRRVTRRDNTYKTNRAIHFKNRDQKLIVANKGIDAGSIDHIKKRI